MVRKSRHVALLLVILLPLSCAAPSAPVSAGPLAAEVIQVFFSPNGGATDAVVQELGNAKKEILVQAYSFTSAPIAKALVDAHKRGVKVTVVLDKSQRSKKYSSADFVNNAGNPPLCATWNLLSARDRDCRIHA